MTFKVIETQEQLDAIIGERVTRAKEAARKEFDGWISPDDLNAKTSELVTKVSTLEQALTSANSEIENHKTSMIEKDSKIKEYELRAVKTQIAHECGLSYDAITFLQGDDAEAIKRSAETLKNLVGANNTPPLASLEKNFEKDSKKEALKTVVSNLRKD